VKNSGADVKLFKSLNLLLRRAASLS